MTKTSRTTQRGNGQKRSAQSQQCVRKGAVVQTSATSCVQCAICCDSNVDGKGDALRCDRCDQWAHSYCSGMSVVEFNTLDGISTPYFCLFCLKKVHQETLTKLQQAVAALTAEAQQLKAALNDMQRCNKQLVSWIVYSR